MSTQESAKVAELTAWLHDYVAHRVNLQVIDERRCFPPYIALDFGNQGLLGLQVPTTWGGLGLSSTSFLKICEQVSAVDLGLTLFVALHNILAIRPIQYFATPTVRDKWLPLLAAGRALGSFGLTEPAAGSNPAGIVGSGIPTGLGTWSLTGHKVWIGLASWAHVLSVFVKVKDENQKNVGITGFVVEQGTKGLRMGPEALTMGMRGMVQNAFYLEQVAVNESQLLGTLGKGLNVAQDAMFYGRLAISVACVGAMKRCMQLMKRYTERRKVGPNLLINNGVIITKMKKIAVAITALEALIYQTAAFIDQGQTVPPEVYCACKILGPEMLWEAVDTLVQVLGGRGYIETNIASRFMRDARIFRVFEGPTETLLQFVGVNMLHHHKALLDFISTVQNQPTIADNLLQDVQKINQFTPLAQDNLTRDQRDQVIINQVGELATWALLKGALNPDNPQLLPAYHWVEQCYQAKLAEAMQSNGLEAFTGNISDIINNYNIADFEESLPGVDNELDPLLRK